MAIEPIGDGGGTIITGKRDIQMLRLMTLVSGLRFEVRTGMRLTRGPTCYTIIKREYGFKGNKKKVLAQAQRLLEQTEARRDATPDGEAIVVPETPPQ